MATPFTLTFSPANFRPQIYLPVHLNALSAFLLKLITDDFSINSRSSRCSFFNQNITKISQKSESVDRNSTFLLVLSCFVDFLMETFKKMNINGVLGNWNDLMLSLFEFFEFLFGLCGSWNQFAVCFDRLWLKFWRPNCQVYFSIRIWLCRT